MARGPDGDWYDDDPDVVDRRRISRRYLPPGVLNTVGGYSPRPRRLSELEQQRRYGVDGRGNRKRQNQGTS